MRANSPVRVLVADDHLVIREGIRNILNAPKFEIVAEATDGMEAVALADRHRPDVALLDQNMPRLSGLNAARKIHAAKLPTRCVLFTVMAKEALLLEAMQAQMAGYLLKESGRDEIRARVFLAAEGEPGFDAAHYRALRLKIAQSRIPAPGAPVAPPPLTPKEETILRLVTQGLSNKEIARMADIQLSTVKSHLANLYDKLEVADRTGAVLRGLALFGDT